jgi:glutamate racemase
VEQIERGELDSNETLNMLRGYLQNMVSAGVDSIVLGCTHYPFLADQIKSVWSTLSDTPPQLIDTGEAVIRHLRNSLQQAQLLQTTPHTPEIQWLSTGNPANLQATLQFLLPGTEHRCTQAVLI